MNERLEQRFADYAAHHTHPLNKLTHAFGIPMIALALYGLGSKVTLTAVSGRFDINAGTLLMLALLVIHLGWHRGLALAVLLLSIPLYAIGSSLGIWTLVGILAAGIALQYVGHYLFEKRAPAFHDNLIHALIAPLWMTSLLFPTRGS